MMPFLFGLAVGATLTLLGFIRSQVRALRLLRSAHAELQAKIREAQTAMRAFDALYHDPPDLDAIYDAHAAGRVH